MRTKVAVVLIPLLAAAMGMAFQAEARRFGGGHVHARPHVRAHVAASSARAAAHTVRHVRRAGRWVNGVWVVGGVAASVAVGTASNCSYYYRKWKQTGSSYWRSRYDDDCR
jgi:hypothetical protein